MRTDIDLSTTLQRLLALALLALLAACAGPSGPRPPERSPDEIRADIARRLPAQLGDRAGWAKDVYTALTALKLDTEPPQVCAVLAVTEQESTFQADPKVPNLAQISRDEIFKRADRAGVPALAVRMALQLESPTGKTYDERLDKVRSERELSEIFEDFIGEVPLGQRLLAGYNPVRTGGPMQVGIAFAEQHARQRPYPYEVKTSLRREVFTRRGGLYFGTAHLLDYPAPYGDEMLYRFADFNAGRYASRNAAFQQAVSVATGKPLDLDGDLVLPGDGSKVGQTEAAVRSLADALGMSHADIRADLEQSDREAFNTTGLHTKVFALADRRGGRTLPRALVPRIALQSPKITRKLTTAWFAQRVNERYQRCLGPDGAAQAQ